MDNWKWNKKRRTKSSLWNFIESCNIKMTYKVAVYLRLSKEEYSNEKESNKITNQKLVIDNYLKEHRKYKLVDYYIDDGYSGTNFDRPEFQRMLEDIKNKLIEIINEKLNLSNITRLELENKVKCIYIDKNKNVKIDIK